MKTNIKAKPALCYQTELPKLSPWLIEGSRVACSSLLQALTQVVFRTKVIGNNTFNKYIFCKHTSECAEFDAYFSIVSIISSIVYIHPWSSHGEARAYPRQHRAWDTMDGVPVHDREQSRGHSGWDASPAQRWGTAWMPVRHNVHLHTIDTLLTSASLTACLWMVEEHNMMRTCIHAYIQTDPQLWRSRARLPLLRYSAAWITPSTILIQ